MLDYLCSEALWVEPLVPVVFMGSLPGWRQDGEQLFSKVWIPVSKLEDEGGKNYWSEVAPVTIAEETMKTIRRALWRATYVAMFNCPFQFSTQRAS
jgi:hypothetical protein